jgi:hypothetical protein
MPSIAMDRKGDIGVGYSFGDSLTFVGQRFAVRLASDLPGSMTLHESVLSPRRPLPYAVRTTLRWRWIRATIAPSGMSETT